MCSVHPAKSAASKQHEFQTEPQYNHNMKNINQLTALAAKANKEAFEKRNKDCQYALDKIHSAMKKKVILLRPSNKSFKLTIKEYIHDHFNYELELVEKVKEITSNEIRFESYTTSIGEFRGQINIIGVDGKHNVFGTLYMTAENVNTLGSLLISEHHN